MLLHLEFPWVSIASDASPREQLRYYREYRGLLRRELGDMTGMSETTILNYELGYMPIAYDKAKRLAKALEIDENFSLTITAGFWTIHFSFDARNFVWN